MIKKLFFNDKFILLLILLNALVIFLSGFELKPLEAKILNLADNLFTVLFIVEMTVKIRSLGIKYFDSRWNIFDFTLVVLSVPALVVYLFNLPIDGMGYLFVFRILRVFKSVRFLKFVPGIEHIISGVRRALQASIMVIIAFAVYIFIIGIFSFYLFKESAPEYFGNPLQSLYSTFKIFTVEGWYEIPERVCAEYSPAATFFTYIYFIFVVVSGGILGLSLVNSIFVDAMVSDNTDALEKKIDRLEEKIDRLLHEKNTSEKSPEG